MTKIILLDIDGVLVQPGGYRAALRSTVQRYLGDFEVEEDLLTDLERRGISSEWDMSPLIIAAYWEEVLSREPIENLSAGVAAAAKQIRGQHKVDSQRKLQIPEFELVMGQYPAETSFQAGHFPHIPAGLRKNLLTESRNVRRSETMRTFQHFTLGSKGFEETYQLPAEFEAKSFLLTEDRPNISGGVIALLKNPLYHPAAFTARPSGLPRGGEGRGVGFAPEAELALELVGMEDIPLMAFGKLEYIAAKHGLDPATLVKPSPFQALAGMLAAWMGDELAALNASYGWYSTGKMNGCFKELPKSFELIVVEDTLGGIRSVQAAGNILQKAGFNVSVRTLGLTSGNPAKRSAFEQAGVPHFGSWEELIAIL